MILFLIPVIAGWWIIIHRPLDKKRAYHYLTDDCEGRGAWMYRRIYESREPIDIAFLGSSHTINGINDTLINQILRDAGSTKTVCNLGYCRLGRDLTYVLMKDLIEQKKTTLFVIEVITDEPSHSHPVFPFMGETRDILHPQTIVNKSYFNTVYSASVARWMYLRQNWMNEPYPYKYALRENFGFTTNTFNADTNMLNASKEKRIKNKQQSYRWTRALNLPYPRIWLKKIQQLAKENGCSICFLYLPPYGSPEPWPLEIKSYQRSGETWVLPDTLLSNKKNWYDNDHMNLRGANVTSRILAEKLLKLESL
jgi:hypothetical protein